MDFARFLDRRDWLETVVAVVLIAAVLSATMAIYDTVSLSTFAVLCLMSLCFATAYRIAYLLVLPVFLRRAPEARPLPIRRALLHAAAILAAAAGGGEAATRVLVLFGSASSAHIDALRVRVISIGLAVLVGIRLVELGYEQLRQRVRTVELREERARRQALHAELAALQARVDPHFLFNSLNTIAGLIEEDPERAVAVVTRLSGLFRHTVHGSRVQSVPLEDEIEAVSAFLEIQTLRFGDRLSWSVRVDPGLETARVPPLILQPLAENAVLHGTSERRNATVRIEAVRIAAAATGDVLLLTVEDDGPGPGGSSHSGSGTSLADLAERIDLLHGSAASLETGAAPGGGFQACLRLPLDAAPREAPEESERPGSARSVATPGMAEGSNPGVEARSASGPGKEGLGQDPNPRFGSWSEEVP